MKPTKITWRCGRRILGVQREPTYKTIIASDLNDFLRWANIMFPSITAWQRRWAAQRMRTRLPPVRWRNLP